MGGRGAPECSYAPASRGTRQLGYKKTIMSDATNTVRARLNNDLLLSMKRRDLVATTVLRSVLAALDNASAVPMSNSHVPVFGRSGDVPRKVLSEIECEAILRNEAQTLRAAAEEYERLGRISEATRFRAELAIVERYLSAV